MHYCFTCLIYSLFNVLFYNLTLCYMYYFESLATIYTQTRQASHFAGGYAFFFPVLIVSKAIPLLLGCPQFFTTCTDFLSFYKSY